MRNDIMVSVICATYNHEKFIKGAIEGVVHQKTKFLIELIIHDDASTDQTAEIIREYEQKYPQIIKPVYQKENQFFKCSISKFVFPKVRGKYIAFCDGDDYWLDEEKLQKQVDFLEDHVDYSMCMHNAIKLNYETGEEKLLNTFPKEGTYSQEQQILAGLGSDFPAFASVVARADSLKDMPEFFLKPKAMDYVLRQYFANRGKVYYFQEPMSVYRVSTPQSYMRKTAKSQSFYNDYTLDMIEFFEKFDQYTGKRFHEILKRKILSDYFGFCVSIEEGEGLKKASDRGLNVARMKEIYQCLSLDYLDHDIWELDKMTDSLFIYGTSRIAPICKKQLENAGIVFEGFVVSDNQMKADMIEDKKVFYLSEVSAKYRNPGFILAVQPVNVDAIVEILKKYGLENYCVPYAVKKMEDNIV